MVKAVAGEGTPEKVNNCGLHLRCLNVITTPPKFSSQSGIACGWWHHDSALFEPGQFSECLWSPSWYYYLVERDEGLNLIQSTLIWTHIPTGRVQLYGGTPDSICFLITLLPQCQFFKWKWNAKEEDSNPRPFVYDAYPLPLCYSRCQRQ